MVGYVLTREKDFNESFLFYIESQW